MSRVGIGVDSPTLSGSSSAISTRCMVSAPSAAKSWRDGRERRREVRGLGHVVEADDADVVGHAPAVREQRRHHAERHLVVAGEHRRRVGVRGELLAERGTRSRADQSP